MATSGARATARDRPYYTRAWQANSWYSRGDPLRSPMRTNFRVERRLPAPPQDWGKPSTSSPRAWWAVPSYSRVDPCGHLGVGRGPRLLKLVPIGDPLRSPWLLKLTSV